MKKSKVTIVRKDETPMELLAEAIIEVSKAAKAMLGSRLTERAIVVLIKDEAPGVSIGDIKKVLHTAADLGNAYIKKANAKVLS